MTSLAFTLDLMEAGLSVSDAAQLVLEAEAVRHRHESPLAALARVCEQHAQAHSAIARGYRDAALELLNVPRLEAVA